MANLWGDKRKDGRAYEAVDFFPSLGTDSVGQKQDDETVLQKQIQANIDSMKMLTWNLQAQGYKPDPDLTPAELSELDKLLQMEMPAG